MNSIKHSAEFEIGRAADEVFPLFTPEGEKLWAPGWEYEDIKNAGKPAEDAVFLTRTHDHASTAAIWLVKRYDPQDYFVQYYKVEPEDKVGIVTVQCAAQSTAVTRVEVAYEYIALAEKGREFIRGFNSEAYGAFIAEWETLILDYFAGTNA